MDKIFSGFREVPLQMAAEPRVVAEDAQYNRAFPHCNQTSLLNLHGAP